MGDFYFLKMGVHIEHASKKRRDLLFAEMVLVSVFDKGLQIGHAFFHLDVAFLNRAELSLGLLETVAAFALDNVGVFVFF